MRDTKASGLYEIRHWRTDILLHFLTADRAGMTWFKLRRICLFELTARMQILIIEPANKTNRSHPANTKYYEHRCQYRRYSIEGCA